MEESNGRIEATNAIWLFADLAECGGPRASLYVRFRGKADLAKSFSDHVLMNGPTGFPHVRF